MEYRYKPEDAVFVRPDLKRGHDYLMRSGVNENKQCLVAIGDMLNFAGKDGFYYIKEDPGQWCWTDEMFVGLADDECRCESLL